jgi:quinohemoprotein ethanol dehydrogenase
MQVIAVSLLLSGAAGSAVNGTHKDHSTAIYLDTSKGRDWPGYGRTFGEQHYSPLSQIDQHSVKQLGLAWSLDLATLKNSATEPIAVDGVLYFASGLSVVHAVDARSGDPLWQYDPHVAEKAGLNLRHAWGVRGISWWAGKIYTGTQDGRLIAIDAKTGKPVWEAQTFDPSYPAHINAAPRVFNGKVIVGFGSTTGANRGYVTTYDAETGRELWRFFTVPGDPAKGFENGTMAMAAKTWGGSWWKFGGGGAVWNAMAYDSESDTVYLGVGEGYPGNHRVRSAGRGDNLFVDCIVAVSRADRCVQMALPDCTWGYVGV